METNTTAHRIVLAIIVVVYGLFGALYAVYTPLWEAPDEPAHFNYIRAIGDTGTLPVLQEGDYNQEYLEAIKSAKFPPSMSVDAIRYESYQPPLYYLAATPIYLAARAGGLQAEVLALRLFSVLLGVALLLAAYAVVRSVLPADPFVALAATGAIAAVPMHIAVSASISNDIAAELVLALILWLAVKRVGNAVDDRRYVIVGGALFGAALLTKSTAYVPGALVLVGAEIARTAIARSRFTGADVRRVLSLFALAAVISSPMFIRNMLTYGVGDPLGLARHNAVVLGQPTTAEMIGRYGLNHILFDYVAVTFKSFWAQFGWMGVLVNDRLYVALMILSGAAAFGLLLYLLRLRRERETLSVSERWNLLLLALAALAAAVDFVGYNFEFFQLQGRYLFPALIPIALLGVLGLRELLAREHVRLLFGLIYVGLLALDAASLFLFIVPQLRIGS
ncbi:MAG: DUF2142 domain-containing protein [Chloroflexi bacterium]|nr:DUF2142 domain-containing protein [Chloroflexota bacterium]